MVDRDDRRAVRGTASLYWVWAFLTALTLLSWLVGTGDGGPLNLRAATAIVLGVAFLKVDLVGRYFMELREAPLLLRTLFDAWVVGVFVILMAIYLS
jgi:hypothetical protein